MVLFVAVVAGVVFISQGQRRIPTDSQARSRPPCLGWRAAVLAVRVNQAGVMPIIFASSLLLFPK